MTCWYCGRPAFIERHDYPGDGRQMCTECNKAAEPGGLWSFYPERKPDPKFKPKETP